MNTGHGFAVVYKGGIGRKTGDGKPYGWHNPYLRDPEWSGPYGWSTNVGEAYLHPTREAAEKVCKDAAYELSTSYRRAEDYVVMEIGAPAQTAPTRKVKGYAVYYVPNFSYLPALAGRKSKWWCFDPNVGCTGNRDERYLFSTKEGAEAYRAERIKCNDSGSAKRFHVVTVYVKPKPSPAPAPAPVDPNSKLDQLRTWIEGRIGALEVNQAQAAKVKSYYRAAESRDMIAAYQYAIGELDRLRRAT